MPLSAPRPRTRSRSTPRFAHSARARTFRGQDEAWRRELRQPPSAAPIYTARHRQQLPGDVVATEDSPPVRAAEAAVHEAFEGLGATWDFYSDIYGRQSIDDEGMPLDATVHYGEDYDNAFWNGSRWSSATETARSSTASRRRST